MLPGGEDPAKLGTVPTASALSLQGLCIWGRCFPSKGLFGPPDTFPRPANLWVWRENRTGLPEQSLTYVCLRGAWLWGQARLGFVLQPSR